MNEVWPMEPGWSCVYSEDPEVCRRLNRSETRSSIAEWFGTYTKGNEWVAEQYRFPNNKRHEIDEILGSVASK